MGNRKGKMVKIMFDKNIKRIYCEIYDDNREVYEGNCACFLDKTKVEVNK